MTSDRSALQICRLDPQRYHPQNLPTLTAVKPGKLAWAVPGKPGALRPLGEYTSPEDRRPLPTRVGHSGASITKSGCRGSRPRIAISFPWGSGRDMPARSDGWALPIRAAFFAGVDAEASEAMAGGAGGNAAGRSSVDAIAAVSPGSVEAFTPKMRLPRR